jgi:glycosyltransferase involved in cell wall biosynthesis
MKFAIDVSTENPFRPSGATGYYVSVAREISKISGDDEIYLIRGRSQSTTFEQVTSSTNSIVLPYSNEKPLRRVAGQQFLLPALLKRHGIDLLNTGNVGPVFPLTPVVATVKTMHAFTAPESLPISKRVFRKIIGGRTARKARLIISNSDSNSEDLVKYFGIDPERIRIVHEALDHGLFKPEVFGDDTDAVISKFMVENPYVLFVSSLWRYKNAEVLIRAAKEFSDALPDLNVIIVGYQPDIEYSTELKNLVSELGLADRVQFVGGQNQRDIAALYRRATALVYPSKNETFGLPLLEAMACGCPVITTTAGSLPEIAGNAAELFDPSDHEHLATIIQSLSTDRVKVDDMRRRGLVRAGEFTWKSTAAKTLAVFREAIAQ